MTDEKNDGDDIVNILELAPKEVASDHYEVLVLQIAAETEEAAQAVHTDLVKDIEGVGGKITLNNFLGAQELAYMIDKTKQGYYGVFEFDMETLRVSELNEKFRIRKDVKRFMITKKRMASEAEVTENARIQAIIEKRKKTKMIKGLTAKEVPTEDLKKDSKKDRKPREQQKPQSLEKQLEKLLSDDIEV